MEISLEQLTQLAEAFKNPDPKYAAFAEAWRREQAKSPAERRADTERMLSLAAQVEVAGGQYAEAAGWLRRHLASKLFTSKIADGTEFHR